MSTDASIRATRRFRLPSLVLVATLTAFAVLFMVEWAEFGPALADHVPQPNVVEVYNVDFVTDDQSMWGPRPRAMLTDRADRGVDVSTVAAVHTAAIRPAVPSLRASWIAGPTAFA